jgi:hypothetical protein
LVLTTVLLAALLLAAPPRASDDTMRVLFIGNSHTYVNNVPGMVESLAVAGARLLETDLSAPGGHALMQHCTTAATLEKIRLGAWDRVVLQEQSQIPVIDYWRFNGMYPAARTLDSLIRENRGSTMFYMTWGWKNGGQHTYGAYSSILFRDYFHMQDSVTASYTMIANELGARVAPVGLAWRLAKTLDTLIQLHDVDECHATLSGSYLGACVFYATLFGADPTGLPFHAGLDSTVATFLQDVAWQTVSSVAEQRHTPDARRGTLDVRPNPTRGPVFVFLLGTRSGLSDNPVMSLRLLDAAGRLIRYWPLATGSSSLRLDLAGLPAGVYLLRLASPDVCATQRLIVRD